jgi:hypothetical protein
MLRGCMSMVDNWSVEGRELTVGIRCHGKVGVETFMVNDQNQCNEDDRKEVMVEDFTVGVATYSHTV